DRLPGRTGVQDLAGTNELDLGHGVAFHIGSVGPGQGALQPNGRPRRRLVPVTAWTEAVPVARWRSPGPIAGRVRRWGCQSIRLPQVAGPTTPSMSSLVDFWYAFTAARVGEPNVPSTSMSAPEARSSVCRPRTAWPSEPLRSTTSTAIQVRGPTTPSAARPSACWKASTVSSVAGPNVPSTAREWPWLRSRCCRVITADPLDPFRSVGKAVSLGGVDPE